MEKTSRKQASYSLWWITSSSRWYLMSFGCTSYHLEELVIHHRLYDACFLEVFSMKDTVGFFDMNSTVTYE